MDSIDRADSGEAGELVWSTRLGSHLEAARAKAGLRRSDLANRLGVSEESIRLWERGSVQPSQDHLVRLIPMLSIEAAHWGGASPEDRDQELPELARRLRAERGERGVTQAAMSALLGVPQATYAGWETGRTSPSRQHLGVLAELLGASEPEIERICDAPFEVAYETWPAFGRLLGERRQALRLSRADLADRLEVSPRAVMTWELGHRRPAPAQLLALAGAVDVPVEALLAALPKRAHRTRLGELIVDRQRELGLRSADVARMVGTTEPTLSRWINGRSKPLARNLEQLASALNLPTSRLVEATG